MNIFNSFRSNFSKTVSVATIVAVVGMYAQPAFTASVAYAATQTPTITLNGVNPLLLTVGDSYTPSIDLNGADVTTSVGTAGDNLSGIVITGGNSNGGYGVDTSAPTTVILTYTINETDPATNAIVGTASVSRTIIISAPVTSTDIASVINPTDMNVANGTAFGSLNLPTTVTVTLSSTTEPVIDVPVVWAQGSYDGNTANTYALSGTLTLPSGITNPSNLTASVNVIVAASGAPGTGGQGNNGTVGNNGSSTPPGTGGQGNNGTVSNTGSSTPPGTGGQGNNGTATTSATTTAPTITLNGANPLTLTVGDTFVDPGATASTTEFGHILSGIVVTGGNASTTGSVDTSYATTTYLVYTVTDTANGLSASTTREVDIVAANNGGGGSPTTPFLVFSGGGGGGGGGYFPGGTTSTSSIAGVLSCPFMTGYVVPGRIANILHNTSVNDPAQIAKLQVFLKSYEGDSNIAVTGVIDQATINGILAFQQKYLGAIMAPWGAGGPSGNVYITTLHEINSIVCGTQPNLTPAEQAVINTYLAEVAANANGSNANGTVSNPSVTNTGSTVGSTSTGTTTSTSSASNASTTGTTGTTTPDNSLLVGSAVSSGAGNFLSNFFGRIFSFFGIK